MKKNISKKEIIKILKSNGSLVIDYRKKKTKKYIVDKNGLYKGNINVKIFGKLIADETVKIASTQAGINGLLDCVFYDLNKRNT